MLDLDTTLAQAMNAQAAEIDNADAERTVARAVESDRLTSSRRRWLGGIAAVAVALVASNITGVLAPGQPAVLSAAFDSPPAMGDFIAFPVKPGEPCYMAQGHTIEQLAAIADTPLWLPDAPAASLANMTGAWTCAGNTEPVLTFGTVAISYERGYGNVSVPEWCSNLSEQLHTGGRVEYISGVPACVLPSIGPGILHEVMLVVDDGVLIRVLADPQLAIDDVVAVARSIDLANPVSG
jgi:hypothetical protein